MLSTTLEFLRNCHHLNLLVDITTFFFSKRDFGTRRLTIMTVMNLDRKRCCQIFGLPLKFMSALLSALDTPPLGWLVVSFGAVGSRQL